MRLLSFLSAIEQSLQMDDPEPQGGTWNNTRMINYHQGVARLSLASLQGGVSLPLGTVRLQSFELGPESTCLKAFLQWKEGTPEVVQTIFERADTNWDSEARRVAANWLNGQESMMPEISLAKAG